MKKIAMLIGLRTFATVPFMNCARLAADLQCGRDFPLAASVPAQVAVQ